LGGWIERSAALANFGVDMGNEARRQVGDNGRRIRIALPASLQLFGINHMLRQHFNEALKTAMLGKDSRTVSTVRLIVAALKDRDIAARSRGVTDGIPDEEVLQMLQQMVKQRRESITLYEQGNRLDLAQQETEEIDIISRFLPKQMSEAETTEAVKTVIGEIEG
jgi:uncharacterized protein YqeY